MSQVTNGHSDTQPFALGTAQLGMCYGIANRHGQPDMAMATEIVSRAVAAGCLYFDTAAGYGDAEATLGQVFAKLGLAATVRVVTKCVLQHEGAFASGEVQAGLQHSLDQLQLPAVWALLLHREADLALWGSGLERELLALRSAGQVRKLGVSCYHPQHARQAADIPTLDVFQVPASLFDRRFIAGGCIADLVHSGRSVFLRSVFLQGLALLDKEALPEKMGFAGPAVATLEKFCWNHALDRRQFALDYVRLRCPGTILLLGAERPEQIDENVKTMESMRATLALCDEWDRVWPLEHDEGLCPIHWPK